MSRVEVITGRERRRRWSEEQKRTVVAESFAPGAIVSDVARRADISAGQICRWRQEFRATAAAIAGFAPVLIAPTESCSASAENVIPDITAAIEVEFAGKIRVRILRSTPPELAAAVVKALSRR